MNLKRIKERTARRTALEGILKQRATAENERGRQKSNHRNSFTGLADKIVK
jgi:hypothetical protein